MILSWILVNVALHFKRINSFEVGTVTVPEYWVEPLPFTYLQKYSITMFYLNLKRLSLRYENKTGSIFSHTPIFTTQPTTWIILMYLCIPNSLSNIPKNVKFIRFSNQTYVLEQDVQVCNNDKAILLRIK